MSFKITFTFELDVKLNYIKNIYKLTIVLKIIFIELL